MADNRKETRENQTRWIFRDSMVEDLTEALETSKTEYECRGLDFGPTAGVNQRNQLKRFLLNEECLCGEETE